MMFMRCKFVSCTVRLLAFFVLCAVSVDASAQSKSQLEKEKAKLELEIKKLNNELAKAKRNTNANTKQLNALNKKINQRTKLINNINKQVSILDDQINVKQDSINIMTQRIDSMKNEYAKVIRVLYKEKQNLNEAALVFDNTNYNHSLLRLKYFKEYSRYRRYQASLIQKQEEVLQQENLKLQTTKMEKNNLLAQEERHRSQLRKEQSQTKRSVNASRQQEKNLTAQISKKEQQRKKLQQQIQKIINEEVAKGGSGSRSNVDYTLSVSFEDNKGKFSWPVYYRRIAREYGRYRHASGGENMNNGIDFITTPATSVFAIFDGVVSRVFTCPNDTKGIIVRHGEYMTVYANLSTVLVKEGSKVSTKQTIGKVASGAGGEGEFSFQLWKGTTSQNPRNWLRK